LQTCNIPAPNQTPTQVDFGETAQDVQLVYAMAPAAQIVVVCGNYGPAFDYVNTTMTPNPNVVSMSFSAAPPTGSPGTPVAFLENERFTNNRIWVASAGDSGHEPEPQWPAKSANVVSAGGSSLYLTTPGPTGTPTLSYFAEYAWSCPSVPCGT